MNPISHLRLRPSLFAALALLLAATATQAGVTVSNVTAVQRPGTKLMDITYDVVSTANNMVSVTLAVTDGGAAVSATSVTGAVGPGVVTGTGKTIVWNAGADWSGNVASLNVTLNADDGVAAVPDGFALIPAGSFQMGNALSASGDGDPDELPVHTVQVSAFYMAKYLVSKALWDDVRAWGLTRGYTDLRVGAGKAATHPVQTITWYDMVKWCNARSEKENLTPCYTLSGAVYKTTNNSAVLCNWSANGYRLPTEAEWEKAARGDLSGKRFPWGDRISQSQANYIGNPTSYTYDDGPAGYNMIGSIGGTSPATSPVGSFPANGYGLYDMAGNLWEWCWDWYSTSYYAISPGTDPRGAPSGSARVIRGGGWDGYAHYCRVADRYIYSTPAYSAGDLGFRVARSSVP